jgi:iron complex outermembrane recepter protein
MRQHIALIAAVTALSLVTAARGQAQATPESKPPKTADSSEAKPEAVETVIVTANRRAEEQQKVSGVVQAISGDQLRKDGVSEIRQLQALIPGMSVSTQEGAVDIYIRGVGTGNNTELGDPGAAPHINGIYLPRPRGLGLMFYDLERVEVNKGPQGTLYGRNALAGTLNIITAKPKLGQSGGFIQADVANRGGRGAEGAYNIPLKENMAMRAAFQYVKRDYGWENASADPESARRTPAGIEDNIGGRLSFLWDPSEKLRVTAMLDGGRENGTGYPGANIYDAVRATGRTADDLNLRRVLYRGPQGELKNDLWGLQSKAEYDFGPFSAELSGSFRSVDFYQRNASSAGIDYPGLDQKTIDPDVWSTVFWVAKSKSKIGELRFFSNDPKARFKWAAGAFGFGEKQQTTFFSLADHGYCCYSGTTSSSSAIFADGTFEVTDRSRVLAGVRFSQEKKYRYGIGGNYALTLGGSTPGKDYDCCIGTRFGTEGFVPAGLSRQDFNVTQLKTPAQIARFLINATAVPGARDTMIAQLLSIANGTNDKGNCFIRPDISNGKECPSFNNGGFSFANLAIPQQQEGSSKARYGDFRLGIEHDLNKDQMVYAKVSTGHKGGGFNDTLNEVDSPLVFKPEHITVYEAGSRNAFSLGGRRALLNVTGFYYDYKDQVLQDLACTNIGLDRGESKCTGFSLVNRNVGGSTIKGLEVEFKLPIGASTTVDLNGSLMDGKFTKGIIADARAIDYGNGGKSPLINVAGNQLPLLSKVNFTARLSQKFALAAGTFDWQAIASYRSSYYLNQFNEDDVVFLDGSRQTAQKAGFPDKQKGYTQLNLGLGYQWDRWRVEGFANNLTNETATQKVIAGPNLNLRFLNDARTYGARVRYTF